MNLPVYLLTAAHLVYAVAGAQRVPLERQLLEAGGRSGRRTCRLYCRVGIGFHLQIHPDGKVNGSHEPSQLSKSCVAVRAAAASAPNCQRLTRKSGAIARLRDRPVKVI